MKIGLDFDGVVTDCGKLKSDGAKKLYGVDIPAVLFKKELVVGKGLLTEKQYRDLQMRIYHTQEMGLLMEPVKDTLRYIPKILTDGHTILIITSREEPTIAQEWLTRQGLILDCIIDPTLCLDTKPQQ